VDGCSFSADELRLVLQNPIVPVELTHTPNSVRLEFFSLTLNLLVYYTVSMPYVFYPSLFARFLLLLLLLLLVVQRGKRVCVERVIAQNELFFFFNRATDFPTLDRGTLTRLFYNQTSSHITHARINKRKTHTHIHTQREREKTSEPSLY